MGKYIPILLFLLFNACKIPGIPRETGSLQSIVNKNLGKDATIIYNEDNSLALCVHDNPKNNSTQYMVIKLENLSILEEDKVQRASLKWINNYQVQLQIVPGIIGKEEKLDGIKIIDLSKYFNRL
jgi:hypothetical protein